MSLRYSYIFRIDTEEPIRFFPGVGNLRIPDTEDFEDGEVYKGTGHLKNMPSFKKLTQGRSDKVDLVLFGQHPLTQQLMSELDADNEVGVDVGLVLYNENNLIIDPIDWLWEGLSTNYSRRQTNLMDIVTFPFLTGAITRKRAGRKYWTNVSHQSRHPGDLICYEVSMMSAEKNAQSWP